MSKCNNCYHKKICIDGANHKTAESCKHYVSEDDVVEVVRCKDCEYRKTEDCAMQYECECGAQYFWESDNAFCSRGRRMDGDPDAE